ncbi:IRO domain-containing protein [Trichonephila clavipes]|uniref:IRO domain-containing protein n=1 Tax=Trichonephila clavipes TaxID=2585209 RepID=A0A8X6R3C5_TRICX|nr:IRO domain-containing protein [Trichonephila clavipes]
MLVTLSNSAKLITLECCLTEMDLGPHHRSETTFRPSVNEPHQTAPPPQPLHQHHYEDSHPSADLLSAASSSLEATSYTPSVSSSQSSSPDLGTFMSQHRPGKDSSSHCFSGDASHLYKPKIWSLADTATNKVVDPSLMPGYPGDLWLGGGGMMPAKGPGPSFQSCAVPFQRLGNYSCSLHGFNPISLQTDTPPQTPPNMKVGATHQTATVPSSAYIESHGSAYMGQSTLCQQDAMGDGQMQDDKMENFPNSHGPGLQQSSSSNQNTATDCISDDYDDPSQYSASSVR